MCDKKYINLFLVSLLQIHSIYFFFIGTSRCKEKGIFHWTQRSTDGSQSLQKVAGGIIT